MPGKIKVGSTVKVKGKNYKIGTSDAKGKKYSATPTSGEGGIINFGAEGYTIAPGTPRGDNYCARSSGIKNSNSGANANDFSRLAWNCSGKKSKK